MEYESELLQEPGAKERPDDLSASCDRDVLARLALQLGDLLLPRSLRRRPAYLFISHTRVDLLPARPLPAARNASAWRFNSASRSISSRRWFTSWISIISCILGPPPFLDGSTRPSLFLG